MENSLSQEENARRRKRATTGGLDHPKQAAIIAPLRSRSPGRQHSICNAYLYCTQQMFFCSRVAGATACGVVPVRFFLRTGGLGLISPLSGKGFVGRGSPVDMHAPPFGVVAVLAVNGLGCNLFFPSWYS